MGKKDHYKKNVAIDINSKEYEDQIADTEDFQTAFEFEKFQWTPDAKKDWADINKDMQAANLDDAEMLAIKSNEDFHSSLEALRGVSPSKETGLYFFPATLTRSTMRRKASTLSLSLSKDGFWRKLSRSRTITKEFSYNDPDQEKKDSGINLNIFRSKRKNKGPI